MLKNMKFLNASTNVALPRIPKNLTFCLFVLDLIATAASIHNLAERSA